MTSHAAQVKERGGAPLGASYWKLWTSSGLSNLADGVFKIALPLLAIQLTQSPTLIAGLSVAATLPWLLFALTAGALADRLDRRKLMLWANLSRALLPARAGRRRPAGFRLHLGAVRCRIDGGCG